MKHGDFHGYKTVIIENEHFHVECLAETGPRIVRLIPKWMGENLFAETPDIIKITPSGEYQYFGGHRLWIVPESLSRSYVLENHGLEIEQKTGGIRLKGIVERESQIRKMISVQLSSSGPFVLVKHVLENQGKEPVKLAPSAITMMRPGGVGILPQQMKELDSDGLLPNRRFALWPDTQWNDRRLRFGTEFVGIKAGAPREGVKIGYFNPLGWMGYLFDDVFFVKRFGVRGDETYPDFGCNSEAFSNHRMVELQSLGPLTELAPKQTVVHTETWEVYKEKEIPKDKFGERSLRERLNYGGGSWSLLGKMDKSDM